MAQPVLHMPELCTLVSTHTHTHHTDLTTVSFNGRLSGEARDTH
ncbi:MAG: hypothetical protein VX910_09665 [Candidatus Latescibacterota bacterium]|nr:hypothetical protein [Candidatus Latescibacterota bacterium]